MLRLQANVSQAYKYTAAAYRWHLTSVCQWHLLGGRSIDRHRIFELGGCAGSVAGLIPITALQWARSCAPSRSSEPPRDGWVSSQRRALCRHVRFGRQGFKVVSNRLVHAFVHMSGWLGQELSRIGASGDMVCRLRVTVRRLHSRYTNRRKWGDSADIPTTSKKLSKHTI